MLFVSFYRFRGRIEDNHPYEGGGEWSGDICEGIQMQIAVKLVHNERFCMNAFVEIDFELGWHVSHLRRVTAGN